MNFIFFTLFYRLNHPQRAMTQEARSAPLEMGISDKLKATFDIGLFGRIWVMDYWLTDVDVPDCDPLGKAYKVNQSGTLIKTFYVPLELILILEIIGIFNKFTNSPTSRMPSPHLKWQSVVFGVWIASPFWNKSKNARCVTRRELD